MFDQGASSFQSETYQNTPNMSLMFTMYSQTFGNGAFMIQPPGPGEVGQGFPSVPYLPLEALIYQQQASNPTASPVNTIAGSNVGEQRIAGTTTASDSTGTARYSQGFTTS